MLQRAELNQHRLLLLEGLSLQQMQLLDSLLVALPPLVALEVNKQLMLALAPLAQALIRQDSLAMDNQQQTVEMLAEVLNSLQPPVTQQLGLSSRPASPPISVR